MVTWLVGEKSGCRWYAKCLVVVGNSITRYFCVSGCCRWGVDGLSGRRVVLREVSVNGCAHAYDSCCYLGW